jgi:drug/metabolite transporter (DMT)-like permease
VAEARARLRATLVGGIAVLLWSALPLLTSYATRIPAFELASITFAIAALAAFTKWIALGESIARHLRQPVAAWAVGVGGLFGYHAFYFAAMRNAPTVDVSLIAYLWPVMIVLLSSLLPGERVRWNHIAGVALGFAGCVLLVTNGGRVAFRGEYALGYALAFACPLIWGGYSVLNRLLGAVPTDAVGGFCAATAILAALAHLAFETTAMPSAAEWPAIVLLGLGPVGAAFFAWDHGTKHGDIRLLGVLSYAAPLISTLLLIAFGRAAATLAVALACALIVGGALVASRKR